MPRFRSTEGPYGATIANGTYDAVLDSRVIALLLGLETERMELLQ